MTKLMAIKTCGGDRDPQLEASVLSTTKMLFFKTRFLHPFRKDTPTFVTSEGDVSYMRR